MHAISSCHVKLNFGYVLVALGLESLVGGYQQMIPMSRICKSVIIHFEKISSENEKYIMVSQQFIADES